jgi:hypothetical protein
VSHEQPFFCGRSAPRDHRGVFFTAGLPLINQLFLMGFYRRLRQINEKLKEKSG